MNKTRIIFCVSMALMAMGIQSCSGVSRPADNDGHNLWLGDITVKSGPADIAAWKIESKRIDLNALGINDIGFDASGIYNKSLGDEGFSINCVGNHVAVTANTDAAKLYAVFYLKRMADCGERIGDNYLVTEVPAFRYRVLNHWDNPNLTVERGYAGKSLWKWEELPGKIRPEYEEYARANASIGINGTVLNNVNADARMLSREYLEKVKVLADIFRPYNIKVYLSLNFAAPKHLAGLKTSDPLDKDVIRWWNEKVAEIYSIIPDFGGFLVKANSEGQSGPQDYGRTHADGANMIADALKPYGGIVMWRAFVYAPESPDRAKQAVEEFKPLDGQFRDNVIIQIKNGPVDFQPREPFSPLFGQLEHTNIMAEMQITQEYLGHSNHMVYLHPMWKECLDSDTYQNGKGSTVAAETLGKVHGNTAMSAIAGVTNIGDSVNWCGHHLAQANWYAFGRMAWNPDLSSEQILDEWLKQTFTADKKFVEPVKEMMLASREACVSYEMPLGLHHTFKGPDHYGPGPWDRSSRPDWEPAYYHKAAADGVGFDRTSKTGTDAVSQYHEPLKSLYDNVETCPENLILWFHHLPWDYKMKDGHTLWEELCYTYQSGIDQARGFIDTWESVEKYVDPVRYRQVHDKLVRQAKDAIWWRDATMLYFQQYSKMDIPSDCTKPQHTLDELRRFRLGISNYETPSLEKLPEYTLE
jgi:alpha-glucuronidase